MRLGNNILSENITIHFYSDSESMIIKLDEMNEYPTAKHKMTLHPEWDTFFPDETDVRMGKIPPRRL